MRFNEFSEITLDEVSMAPGKLRSLAASIKGVCGIEFELLVPNVSTDDYDQEPDFDHPDVPVPYSIEDIIDFFSMADGNSSYTLKRLRSDLEEQYYDYVDTEQSNEWEHVRDDEVRNYIVDYEWDEDEKYEIAYDDLGLSDDEKAEAEEVRQSGRSSTNDESFLNFQKASRKVEEMLDDFVDECIKYKLRPYDKAFEEWSDSYQWPDESDWLQDSRMSSMKRIYDKFDLSWPYLQENDDIYGMIYSLEAAVGSSVEYCSSYHDCQSLKGKQYVVEPDSSINTEAGYAGLEIVSPALALDEMIAELSEVIKWAKSYGCETNDSCGLHMNVSIENVDLKNLDYVKLALFLGDMHILNQFDRLTNTYCKSAIKYIQQQISNAPNNAYTALESLQKNLAAVAGRLIHDNVTDKYTSINVQDNRVEFRSPGGNWLDIDVKTLENTVYRFVVALDIACDTSKYPQEYAKKLYKLVNPEGSTTPSATLFANYQSGVYNLTDLKQQMGSLRTAPATPQKSPTSLWIVTGPNDVTGTYTADTPQAAINKMRTQLKLNSVRYPNNLFTAEPSDQTDIFNTFGK